MHFFVVKLLSIAVMTYSYVYHLRNLRPTNLLRTQRINFSMRPQQVRMTRDTPLLFDVSFLENSCEYRHMSSLYCQKLKSLNYRQHLEYWSICRLVTARLLVCKCFSISNTCWR